MSSIFNFGCLNGLMKSNPMKNRKRIKERPREFQLNVEDLKRIMTQAEPHVRWAMEVCFNLETRPGTSELLSLKWHQVNFNTSTVKIYASKTNTYRIVPVKPLFLGRLKEMMGKAKSEYLIEFRGKPVTTIRKSFNTACEAAGIEYPVRMYDLRHLFTTTMLTDNADLAAVSKLMGHATVKMTADTYYLCEASLRKVKARLDSSSSFSRHTKRTALNFTHNQALHVGGHMHAVILNYLDVICLAISTGLFLLYHLFLSWKLKSNPIYTLYGATKLAKTDWVVNIMEYNRDILAVQTLRNSTMAATFLASTAILLAVGVLTLSGQADKLGDTWNILNQYGSTTHSTMTMKLLVILAVLFIAFFSFSFSIRLFSHVGFIINTPTTDGNYGTSITFVAMQLTKAGTYFYIGMRAYYFLVPLVFWLFDPQLMLVSAIVLIVIMFLIERTPKLDCTFLSEFYKYTSCPHGNK